MFPEDYTIGSNMKRSGSRLLRLIMSGAVLVLLTITLFAGCGHTPDALPMGIEVEVPGATFSFDEETYPASTDYFSEYRIAAGDLLDILFHISTTQSTDHFRLAIDNKVSVKFVNVPELNETQNIQPDGKIVLPYIGQVSVVGKTIDELTRELKKRYSSVFRDPEIYVVVPEFSAALRELKADLHTAPRGLSRLVTVRPDGYATFPMIGDVFVAGKSVPEANKDIDERYKQETPGLSVNLFLEKTHGSVVFVMGEVNKSGAYSIEKPISVFEAITLAGGHMTDARLDNIIVFRRKDRKITATRIDLESLLSLRQHASYFYLKPDDLVYVPKTRIASAAQLMTHLGEVIWFRGWSLNADIFSGAVFDTGTGSVVNSN